MAKKVKPKSNAHPKENANIVSLITFFYSFDIFKKGYQKSLELDDLYDVLSSCKSKTLGDKLEKQVILEKKNCKRISIIHLLWSSFGKIYMVFGVIHLIMRTIFVLLVPEAIGKLVSFFTPGQTNLTIEDAYYYASIVIGVNIMHFIYMHNYMMILTEFGIKVRTSICSLIFRKSLKLTEASLNEVGVGKIVTLMTKDVHSLEMLILFGNDVWISLIQSAVICFIIYQKIGVAAFAGVGFFFVVLPLQILVGKLATTYRLKSSKKTDERLQLTQEILSAIKIIKMYAWEAFFANKLAVSRKKEVSAVFKLFYLKIIIIVIGGLSAKIGFYLLIMTYAWLGNNITAEIVYFVMACFGKLHHLLSIVLPLGISFFAEFYATIMRLNSLVDAEELNPKPKERIENVNSPKISFKNVTVTNKNVVLFKNVTLNIEPGLNIVVGHIGCGKTSFLKAILQNYKVEGELLVSGKISYAPQEPWLFPSSIRNNIIFGDNFFPERYENVLEICALKKDLKSFDNGDRVIVGDHGLNLSKGQQARINLARAIYKNCDIYLLDDCLASLDGNVSDFIFEECIRKFLKDKIIIFVTNNEEHLPQADNIIEINSGSVVEVSSKPKTIKGTPNEEIRNKVDACEEVSQTDEDVKREIYRELKKSGKVELDVYKKYFKFGGGYFIFSIIMVMFVAVQTATSYSEKLVSNWVTLEQNLSSFKIKNLTNSIEYEDMSQRRTNLLNLYTILIISAMTLSLLKSWSFFNFNRKASVKLHKVMLSNIIGAKIKFFDSHFIGNVLNRFSKDLCTIDEHLPFVMNECFELMFIMLGILGLVAIVNPIFLIPAAVFFILVFILRFIYLRTGRSLQRLEASTRSPLIGHLNASLEGLVTIRAFNAEQMIKDEFDKHQDLYTSANYCLHNSTRALGFVLDGMCSVFITLVIAKFLLIPVDTTVGNVGLAISQAFHLTGLMQFGIRKWADFENQMTSVERVLEYTEIDQENKNGKIVESWPNSGKIKYDNVSLNYGSEKRLVLKEINIDIGAYQKIGIVGRTGAGKSSIISTLFRLYDIDGKIEIDEVDIKELSLNFLRSNLSIIPQDPIIFSGTFRDNIDPLKQYADEEIWKVIKVTKLDDLITNLTDATDNNANFSSGQKQLICLARAIIRKSKIVILDEATANLDQETDILIRRVIEENFTSCSVITIAHRLSSVLATDMVLVIDDGQVVEKDHPNILLENKKSLFSEMIKQT